MKYKITFDAAAVVHDATVFYASLSAAFLNIFLVQSRKKGTLPKGIVSLNSAKVTGVVKKADGKYKAFISVDMTVDMSQLPLNTSFETPAEMLTQIAESLIEQEGETRLVLDGEWDIFSAAPANEIPAHVVSDFHGKAHPLQYLMH